MNQMPSETQGKTLPERIIVVAAGVIGKSVAQAKQQIVNRWKVSG